MPPEFSGGLYKVQGYMDMLAYTDAKGRKILRRPGLTDLPGGATTGSAVTAVMGLILAARPGTPPLRRVACISIAGLGLVTLYLTFVRSLLMGAVVIVAFTCLLLARQGRLRQGLVLVVTGGVLVIGSFRLTVTLGGNGVFQRFFGIL
jgi:hypothetical protein